MEIESLFGLPAHPLVVHAAVVLLPLAAAVTLLCCVVPRLRRSYAPVALAVAFAATVAVGLAQGSGEKLEDDIEETELVEEHTEQGERVLPWAIGVTVVAAAATAVPSLTRRRPNISMTQVTAVLVVLGVVVSAGAVYEVAVVGHSGAKATWDDVGEGGVRGGESGEDDD